MNQPLTDAERRLIERELIAREEVQAKRTRYFRLLFIVGVTSSVIAAFCRAFRYGGFLTALLGLASLVCLLLYSEFLTIPRTFGQDMSPGWHLNPWQEAIQRMGADGRVVQGIIMLAVYPVSLMIFSFISLGFGAR